MMTRTLFTVSVLCLLATACGGPKRTVAESPAWSTEEGKTQIRLDLAKAMIDGERYNEALAMVSLLRSEGQKDPRIDLIQGRCLAAQGLFTEAEAFLQQAASRMKKTGEPHHYLGVLFADSGRTQDAVEAFRAATELSPDMAKSWNNLGFLLLSSRQFQESTPALREAVNLNPNSAKYRMNLAYSLFGEQKQAESLRVFKSVLNKADAHYNFGVAHELAGNVEKAYEYYDMALSTDPQHQQAIAATKRMKRNEEVPQ